MRILLALLLTFWTAIAALPEDPPLPMRVVETQDGPMAFAFQPAGKEVLAERAEAVTGPWSIAAWYGAVEGDQWACCGWIATNGFMRAKAL